MAKRQDNEPPAGKRQAHHQADEADKQGPRAIALKTELLVGPVLAFAVGAVTIGGFLAYIGSGFGTIMIGGLIAGVVMAVGTSVVAGI
ncbi:MAG: hypothetical protein KI792_07200 [Alphaproteobacteria bacterium]|nr:hypothetical protein [Alphaproteobacteria bacterium SS10]